MEWYFGLIAAGIGLLFIPYSVQIRRRGQSLFAFLPLIVLSLNPIYPLIMLGILPNRKRLKLREQFDRELEAKLAVLSQRSSTSIGSPMAPMHSIGDVQTHLPERSLGDQPTTLPQRSLGDEQTRL